LSKKILLIVRRTSGEIDWILPLFYKLKKNYEIVTIFESNNVFNDLKRNRQLFELWGSISKIFYIRNFYDNFFERFFLILYSKINKAFPFCKKKNIRSLYEKIFIKGIIFSKLKIKNIEEIKFLFHDSGGFTGWIDAFKNSNIKIVYFPHSTIEYSRINNYAKNLKGDLMIVGTLNEKKKWQKFFNGKVVNSGHLKYSSFWLKKFNTQQKKDCKKIKIVLPMKDWKDRFEKKKLRLILSDVFEVLEKNSNRIILNIKLSRKNYYANYFFLKSMLRKYNFHYSFKKESLLSLAKSSGLFLVFNDSSVAYDALSNKVASIELWNKTPKTSSTKKYTFQAHNKLEFEEIIVTYFKSKLKNELNKKYKIFSYYYLSKISYKKVMNFF